LDGFLNTLLQGRAQTADEIATAALFLCSIKPAQSPGNRSTSTAAQRFSDLRERLRVRIQSEIFDRFHPPQNQCITFL